MLVPEDMVKTEDVGCLRNLQGVSFSKLMLVPEDMVKTEDVGYKYGFMSKSVSIREA